MISSLLAWLQSFFLTWLTYLGQSPFKQDENAIDYENFDFRKDHLLDSSSLNSKLLGWPDQEFSPNNCCISKFEVSPFKQKTAGDAAIDFELIHPNDADPSQTKFRCLKDLLNTNKPVLMVSVSSTCPHFMSFAPQMEKFANLYGDRVICLAVTIVQPHPAAPDTSFEKGEIWEVSGFSKDLHYCRTFEERVAHASSIQKIIPSWIVVADDLRDEKQDGLINPWWSTYGPAARCAFLVSPNGMICHSQLWWEFGVSSKAIEAYEKASK